MRIDQETSDNIILYLNMKGGTMLDHQGNCRFVYAPWRDPSKHSMGGLVMYEERPAGSGNHHLFVQNVELIHPALEEAIRWDAQLMGWTWTIDPKLGLQPGQK